MEQLVIIGAGAGGLSAAWLARQRGLEPLVLDRAPGPGGAWARLLPDMRCLSPRRFDRLPDGSVPAGRGEVATAAEVLAWLLDFAGRERLHARWDTPVVAARRIPGGIRLHTSAGDVDCRRLILATGEHGRPRACELPGRFDGPIGHASAVRSDTLVPGERVCIVGGGNSGAQMAALAVQRGAVPVVAARRPVARPLPLHGALSDLANLLAGLPLGALPPGPWCQRQVPLADPWLAEARARGLVQVVPAAVRLAPGAVELADGRRVPCDRVVLATGYRRDLQPFADLIGLDADGRPRHHRGLAAPDVGLVGLPCQTNRRSGFLRGMADDAHAVLRRLA